MGAVGFDQRALDAQLIITGEGAVDLQTVKGKLVHAVTARAHRLARACAVIAGQVNLPDAASQLTVITATPAQSRGQITAAARDICRKALT
jgi:glycerate 2-kinase